MTDSIHPQPSVRARAGVSVIGLGTMGGAVASRLAAAGYEVNGYDPNPEAARRAGENGILVADDPAEAVAAVELVITSLPDSATVHAMRGRAREESSLRPERLSPRRAEHHRSRDDDGSRRRSPPGRPPSDRLRGERRTGRGVRRHPGSARWSRRHRSSRRPAASRDNRPLDRPYGACRDRKIVKLVNNMMSMGNVLVAAEAFEVGRAAGVEPQRLYDVLSTSGGSSQHFVKRFPWVLADDRRTRFSIGLAEKDLRLGAELARSVGMPAPTASMVRSLYEIAIAKGFGSDDIVALTRLYRGWRTEWHDINTPVDSWPEEQLSSAGDRRCGGPHRRVVPPRAGLGRHPVGVNNEQPARPPTCAAGPTSSDLVSVAETVAGSTGGATAGAPAG